MKKEVLPVIIFLLILFPLVSAQVMINEVMPHSNNTFNDEWVELYNPLNETLILTTWKINDTSTSDKVNLTINPYSFALIVDIGNNYNNLTGCAAFNITNSSCFELSTIGSGLNDDGDIVYLYNNYSILIDSFSWNENIKDEGKSWARNLTRLWQKCAPTPGLPNYCPELPQQNQTNQTNPAQPSSSYIEIQDSPEEAKFGDSIDIKVNIYRRDTSKYAVYARVEQENGDDVSEETTLHVLTKYINYSVKLPIQLKLNCNDKYIEDDYKIIVEGLGTSVEKEIKLSGKSSLCPKENNETSKSTNKTKENIPEEQNESISNNPENSEQSLLAGDVIYSKGATTLKITPYLLSLLCLFIAFYTIKKNGQRN